MSKLQQLQKTVDAQASTIEAMQSVVAKPLAILRKAKHKKDVSAIEIANATVQLAEAMNGHTTESNSKIWSKAIEDSVSNPNRIVAMSRLGKATLKSLCRVFVNKEGTVQPANIGVVAVKVVANNDESSLNRLLAQYADDGDACRKAVKAQYVEPPKGKVDRCISLVEQLTLSDLHEVESAMRARKQALKEESRKMATSIDVTALSPDMQAAILNQFDAAQLTEILKGKKVA